jgi:integrase
MRTILYGIFKRAKKKHYIEWSITEVVHDMELSRKSFRRVYHTNEELIFTEDELPKVLEKLYDNLDTLNLGLLLLFKSGIRIGELAALRPDNIGFNVIYITATEISYIDNDGNDVYEVRNFPKTEAGIREVVLKEEDRILLTRLRALNPFGRYLFERDGERILTKTFRRRLRTVCRQAGVKSKSPNKARKTYGTILLDSGIPESLVIEQMGHTNIATTKGHYYVNRKSTCQKEQELNKVCFL